MVQTMEETSPVRWHLAHTTWFFETFVLKNEQDYREYDPNFAYLFNSYYNSVGSQFPRPERGAISRPGLAEVQQYRRYVEEQMLERMESRSFVDRYREAITIGLNHEQQHQELILTDIKHALATNPVLPVYSPDPLALIVTPQDPEWCRFPAGQYEIGHASDGFCFDNELPRHTVYLAEFSVCNQLVTCGQFLEFIDAGGYQSPEYWLSLGWNEVQSQNVSAPLYWVFRDNQWMTFTLAGLVPVNPDWPVCHLSYFEADAFARWAGKRLPTEFEWEIASQSVGSVGGSVMEQPGASENGDQLNGTVNNGTVNNGAVNSGKVKNRASTHDAFGREFSNAQFADRLLDSNYAIHPTAASAAYIGSVWQWTSSSYQAYPGYRPLPGAIGEYNGKFMCNQYVLRGGSVATPSTHIRTTYRNFFAPAARWQFSGLRLASD